MHSEGDLRCSVEQAEHLFTIMRLLGKEVEFVRFPRRGPRAVAFRRAGAPRAALRGAARLVRPLPQALVARRAPRRGASRCTRATRGPELRAGPDTASLTCGRPLRVLQEAEEPILERLAPFRRVEVVRQRRARPGRRGRARATGRRPRRARAGHVARPRAPPRDRARARGRPPTRRSPRPSPRRPRRAAPRAGRATPRASTGRYGRIARELREQAAAPRRLGDRADRRLGAPRARVDPRRRRATSPAS